MHVLDLAVDAAVELVARPATSISATPPSTTIANTAITTTNPNSPRRLNELPQYGQRGPLSNEIRAQCGQTR